MSRLFCRDSNRSLNRFPSGLSVRRLSESSSVSWMGMDEGLNLLKYDLVNCSQEKKILKMGDTFLVLGLFFQEV